MSSACIAGRTSSAGGRSCSSKSRSGHATCTGGRGRPKCRPRYTARNTKLWLVFLCVAFWPAFYLRRCSQSTASHNPLPPNPRPIHFQAAPKLLSPLLLSLLLLPSPLPLPPSAVATTRHYRRCYCRRATTAGTASGCYRSYGRLATTAVAATAVATTAVATRHSPLRPSPLNCRRHYHHFRLVPPPLTDVLTVQSLATSVATAAVAATASAVAASPTDEGVEI